MSASAVRAGRAFVELFLKDGVSKGLAPIEARLRGFTTNVKTFGAELAKLGAVGTAPLALSAKNFASFETTMANVATVLEQPQMHLKRMSGEVRNLSQEFGESVEVIGSGLYEILSATIAPEDAMTVLRAAMVSARAGVTDTATATNMLISILNAYHIPAKDAADVTDLLFQVMKRGTTTLPELAQHIGNVVSQAYAAEVSIEEMGAAIATMTRNGIKTDMAMTALNNMLSEFIKPSKQGKEVAEKFGIELSVASLKANGLLKTIEQLSKLPKDALAEIFPDARGIRGVFSITEDVAGFTKDMEEMKDRAGASMVAFGNHADTMTMHLGQMWEVAKDLTIEVGSSLGPMFSRLALLTRAVALPILDLISSNRQVVQWFALAAGSALILGTSLLGIASAGAALGAMLSFLGVLLNPLVMIPVALMAVGTAAAGAGVYWATFSADGQAALSSLGDAIEYLSYLADEAFMGIGDALAAGDLQLAANIAMLGMKAVWLEGLSMIASSFDNEWAEILRLLFSGDLAGAGEHAMEGLWHAFQRGLNAINGTWKIAMFYLNEAFLANGIDLAATWKTICDSISYAITKVVEGLSTAMDWLLSIIGTADEAANKTAQIGPGQSGQANDKATQEKRAADDAERRKRMLTFAQSFAKNGMAEEKYKSWNEENKNEARAKGDAAHNKALGELNEATKKAREAKEAHNKQLEADLAAAKAEREARAQANADKIVPQMEQADKEAKKATMESGTFSVAGKLAMAAMYGEGVTDDQKRVAVATELTARRLQKLIEIGQEQMARTFPASFK